ncbi:MAG: hypothetical protein NC344_02220 [Bacteroidales bacterium]|nr:hypothetical protein [Bacteroidales bacterium]MCM1146648.1 hypothetical protein [Bacteroidales bacterium]MCM1206040.1 hypothetical protein [Bacillota bacterium]MCM1511060.1 hypothetical protein [Clostridium sp.]
MGQFFGSMYCWFENFFGIELADYLWGNISPEQTTNSFIGIGWLMFAISIVVVLTYYYLFDNPRLNHWWGWGIFLVVNAVANFVAGWQWVLSDSYNGKMIKIDPASNLEVALNIGDGEMLCFGVSNMFLSIMAFFLFSMCLKWWSTNCRNAPFVK